MQARRITCLVVASIITVLATAVVATAAGTETGNPTFSGIAGDGLYQVNGDLGGRGDDARALTERVRAEAAPGPVRVVTFVVACPGNGPGADERTGVLCDAARLGCQATPDPGDILYWRWPGTRAVDGTVAHDTGAVGTVCLGPQEAAEGAAVAVPDFTLADFRRLPLPAGTPGVQPATGRVLVNVPTNVYVDAAVVVLDTVLVGLPVQVRATPAQYSWDFGDGGRLGPTSDPGAPYPDLRTTHTYTAGGQYAITLTTAYTGEYAVAGGPWLPIDGQAEVASEPVPVTVLTGRNRLVADTLP